MVPIHFNLSRYIQIQINIPLSPIPALLVEGAWGGHTLHVKALLYYVLHILAGWEELMMLKIGE